MSGVELIFNESAIVRRTRMHACTFIDTRVLTESTTHEGLCAHKHADSTVARTCAHERVCVFSRTVAVIIGPASSSRKWSCTRRWAVVAVQCFTDLTGGSCVSPRRVKRDHRRSVTVQSFFCMFFCRLRLLIIGILSC